VAVLLFVLAVLNADGRWPRPVLLLGLSASFFIVASGNRLFGLLSNRAAMLLGDISYGIYLLHGLVLYIFFEYLLGRPLAAQLSASGHWLWVAALVVATVLLSWLSYRYLEMPMMQRAPAFAAWLRQLGGRQVIRQA
jgi:peptidoglycan/LPS O-acetylase OafA/YrhL